MKKMLFSLGLLAASVSVAKGSNASIVYGANGLSAISYNGTQYLSNGNFGVNGINFIDSNGQITKGSVSGTTVYDPAHSQTTISFSWGRIVVAYTATGNKVNVAITTTNNSSLAVQGVFYEPMDVQFPSAPQEFDGVDPILGENLGTPTALRMTAGPNALVLANDDVKLPLLVGFPWSLNKPTNTVFPIRVETSQDSMFPNSIPFINRPIAPGGSDTYSISLRFGAASATTKSLVSDVYQNFAAAYPSTLHWTDRRPIGQLVLGSTATGFPTNPRGWFNDPSVDVTTSAGIAAFQARLISWAQSSVAILKSMNAQGMVTWDIEGEQYPQPTTYIGDPTVYPTLAPEMQGVADLYFQTFTNAGLRVGICIRPQQLVIPPGGGAPTQTTVADPTQLLLAKVAYARTHWGATLFYIDSNGDPNFPISSTFFQTVAAQYPDVLLIPEHQNTSYFAFGSWYGELRGGVTGTPQSVLDVYPQAFSVIYLPDGNFTQNQSTLQKAISRGDIAMFRAWYADPQNQEIYSLYPSDGVAPPVPAIATPANNSTVAGTVDFTSNVAPGSLGVTSVQYLVDGLAIGSSVNAPPFTESFDTSALSTGLHNVQALAMDAVGDGGFATSTFFVNGQGGSSPPTVAFTAPVEGGSVSAVVQMTATASASAGVASLQFAVDGLNWGGPITVPPYQMNWNTMPVLSGPHVLSALVTDSLGQTASASVTVTVNNATGTAYVSGLTFIPTLAVQNLTGLGTSDWAQWGLGGINSVNRKMDTAAQIGGMGVVGSGSLLSYTNNPIGFSWTDGFPSLQVTNTATGLFICGQGNGFTISVPAGTSSQTLTIYTGVYMAQLHVDARLSDGSAAPFVDDTVSQLTGQEAAGVVISYRAASAGQTLTVTLTQGNSSIDPWSNITLSAAALRPYGWVKRSAPR